MCSGFSVFSMKGKLFVCERREVYYQINCRIRSQGLGDLGGSGCGCVCMCVYVCESKLSSLYWCISSWYRCMKSSLQSDGKIGLVVSAQSVADTDPKGHRGNLIFGSHKHSSARSLCLYK